MGGPPVDYVLEIFLHRRHSNWVVLVGALGEIFNRHITDILPKNDDSASLNLHHHKLEQNAGTPLCVHSKFDRDFPLLLVALSLSLSSHLS